MATSSPNPTYGDQYLKLALNIAAVAHAGVSRRGTGEPYEKHVYRVVDGVHGWRQKTIAALHDVIEDSHDPVEMEAALRQFFPDDIIDDVMRLTRPRDVTYADFIERICDGNEDTRTVKLADINDNLADIDDQPGFRNMKIRYLKAKARIEETLTP